MNENPVFRRPNPGVTLTEILVVIAIAAGMVAAGVGIMTQFQKWFAKGGDTGLVLQDLGIFLAYLRHDILNVVGAGPGAPDGWESGMTANPEQLSLRVFYDENGTVGAVDYLFQPDPRGGTIRRVQANGSSKVLVLSRVSSLRWKPASETVSLPGSGRTRRRVWLEVGITVGGQGRAHSRAGEVSIETRFFPRRLNDQLNSQDAPP